MVDTELAWELADAARGHLDARERNEVYVGIAAGDAFWAVTFLLRTIVRAGLAVRPGLVPKLFRWVAAYDDHPEQAHLRYLIGRIRIQPMDPRRGVPTPPILSLWAANSTADARIGSATISVQQPGLATLTVRRPRPAPSQGAATNDDLRRR
jgi:hypothetical protein